MSYRQLALSLAAGVLSFASQSVFAQSASLTMDVQSVIPRLCYMYSVAPLSLTPQNAKFADGSDRENSTTLTYRCTNGTTPTSISYEPNDGGTGRQLSDGGSNVMPYELSVGTLTMGTGFGSDSNNQTVSLTGTLRASTFLNAPVGTYNDSVVLTINY